MSIEQERDVLIKSTHTQTWDAKQNIPHKNPRALQIDWKVYFHQLCKRVKITYSWEIFIENFKTACIIHVGDLNNIHKQLTFLQIGYTNYETSVVQAKSDLISCRKFFKIKYTSSFNASYHTAAKVNCTELKSIRSNSQFSWCCGYCLHGCTILKTHKIN